jgi:hypothetical protein
LGPKIDRRKAVVDHWLRSAAQNSQYLPVLNINKYLELVKEDWLPSLKDQANNLTRLVGDAREPGELFDLALTHQFIIGAARPEGIGFLSRQLVSQGLCEHPPRGILLTLAGWEVYNALKRGIATGRKAFMAMPFGKPELDETILRIAKRAAKSCDFHLSRVDDQPVPGLIDILMRVVIQEARFAVVNLTYANSGAYWEAGFAEGMGSPLSIPFARIMMKKCTLTRLI